MRESVHAQARHTQIALLAKISDFKVRSTESERFQRAKSKSLRDEVHLRWMKSAFGGLCRGDQWSPEFRRFFAKAQNDVFSFRRLRRQLPRGGNLYNEIPLRGMKSLRDEVVSR